MIQIVRLHPSRDLSVRNLNSDVKKFRALVGENDTPFQGRGVSKAAVEEMNIGFKGDIWSNLTFWRTGTVTLHVV